MTLLVSSSDSVSSSLKSANGISSSSNIGICSSNDKAGLAAAKEFLGSPADKPALDLDRLREFLKLDCRLKDTDGCERQDFSIFSNLDPTSSREVAICKK